MPASPSPAPRAMKRELAFALQSLSAMSTSPGRTRSGRPLSSSSSAPAPAPAPKRRRRPDKPSDQDKDLLVSPHTPPMDAEAPKPIHLLNDKEGDDGSHQDTPTLQSPPHGSDAHPKPMELNASAAATKPTQPVELNAVAATPHAQPTELNAVATAPAVPIELDAAAVPAESTELNAAATAVPAQPTEVNDAAETVKPIGLNAVAAETANPGLAMELQEPPTVTAANGNKPWDVSRESNGQNLQHHVLDNAINDPSLLAESTATPPSTAGLKPARRFTRSLLKNKPEEEPTASKSQDTAVSMISENNNEALVDLALAPEKPQRRFTRSLLKVKVEGRSTSNLLQSKEAIDSTSDSSRSVKKMEMKMSKKVACLTKHPSNIRELLNTGLLEGMPVRYIIPSSKKAVLKGVITGCNIRCFCLSCNGSKIIFLHHKLKYLEVFYVNVALSQNNIKILLPHLMLPDTKLHGFFVEEDTIKYKRDTGLHKLVFKVLLDGTEVAYYVDGQRKVDGYIKDQRIYCNHCNRVVSPSAFEAHAGEGTRRKPYDNIFTSNGVSLHELSMKISKDMELSERETDDLCRECGQGGDIFPCKMCPRSFHPACVGLSGVPTEWYCDNCSNLVQKEKALAENKNAKAAGRQAGVDSIEQIMKRAIRIVPISDDLGGCALCKQKDFNNSVFDERTVILCDQCEKEYHVGCLRSQWQVDLKELPEGEWFCCNSCSEIRSSLDKIISDGALMLAESDIDIIRKKHEMKGLSMDTNTDLRWRLLAGRRASEDGDLLLSAAVPIIHQSFDPIIEVQSGRDLIPEMVNGRRPKDGMPGQDYSGMFCAVLTLGTSVVSAALLRVMGGEVAELPLVATSKDLQGLGYFQALFSCIERMLISLKIKHFMLPAAQEAEGIWMNKFGFSKIPQEQSEAYLNGAHLTIFHGTSNLYKAIPSS
uniref:Zinc finger PHD-type domain-containing protein n=1 Tax=Oryza punctata TaxID=4537 RepID=A0A0E0L6P9_ORYPU